MDSKVSSDNLAEYFMDNQNVPKEEEFSCYLCNATYEKDLQLAAELGKTLLERNKELETTLKNHQNLIEDQSQEIDYLTKQTAALKEVNSSRIKIYEQLEISIQDLEYSKETLSRQAVHDKKQIKSLHETIETLESRVEELQNSLNHVTAELEREKRQRSATSIDANESSGKMGLTNKNDSANKRNSADLCTDCTKLSMQLQESKSTCSKDQKIIEDLREQLSLLLQENNYLQEQVDILHKKDEEVRSIQEELAAVEQIRVGNLCKRCLRSTILTEDYSSADEISLVLANEEEQELARSIAAVLLNNEKTSPIIESQPNNPYRMLVEKYEALLKIQEQQHNIRQRTDSGHVASTPNVTKSTPCMSLHDELQLSGNFYENDKKDMTDSELEEDDVSEQRLRSKTTKAKSVTTSPGFSDGIVHKGTQTEIFAASLPGSFLCRISDGNDCQFSIYDNSSPVESRFTKSPKYKKLFQEIFAVLKTAADATDEGESLPLLDDRLPNITYPQTKVPPVTPAREEQPFVPVKDEIPETVSSGEQPPAENVDKQAERVEVKPNNEEDVPSSTKAKDENPLQPDVMAMLMEGVRPKRNLSRGDRRALVDAHRASPSPSPSRSSSKRRANSKARRKRERLTDSPNRSRERHQQKSNRPIETVNNLEMFDKLTEKKEQPLNGKRERPVSMFVFGSGTSSASQEVAKLKILEKSYAEVLRARPKKTGGGW